MEAIIHPFALCNHSMPCGPLERKNNIKNLYNFHLGVHTISDVRTYQCGCHVVHKKGYYQRVGDTNYMLVAKRCSFMVLIFLSFCRYTTLFLM